MTIKKPTPPAVGDGAPGEFDNTTPATPTPGKMSDRDIASKMGAAYGVDPVDLGSGFLAPPPMGPKLDWNVMPGTVWPMIRSRLSPKSLHLLN